MATLGELARPKQWPILAASSMSNEGFPVYGANGPIGHSRSFTHSEPVILVGCRGTCGSVHVTPPGQIYANGNAMALDQLDPRVDIRYLAFWLRKRGFRDVITGSSQPQITRQNIVRVEVPLPPLHEQRRIADILDRADALRAKRRQSLALLDDHTQSIFLDMFGDVRSNSRGYPSSPLVSLGVVRTGKTPPSAMAGAFEGNIPFVTPGDLGTAKHPARVVSDEAADLVGTVRRGATLVCCIGATIGKVGMAASRSAFNQQINAVEWSPDVDDIYGLMSMKLRRDMIARLGTSTTLPILNKSGFMRIEIPVPPLELQLLFRERYERSQRLRAIAQSQAEGAAELFAALQHRAFAGLL
ncbi:MAG: restriction endonuclease subunit S [Jatrophihabitans sp.]|uniref:restriction endonuclease subunit S n=1 Tax=Jatrophihabitans sp. TaxID=1932789 RepID=UPI003F7D681D